MKSLALVVLDKKGLFLCFRYSLYKPMFCVTLVGGGGGGDWGHFWAGPL